MRIGEVAARTEVSTRSLRYYEEQRLLSAERTDNGQRRYGEEVVERVQLIQRLYAAGLNSKTIGELLPCVHTGVATPEMLGRLRAERERVDRQVRELVETRDRLDGVIAVAQANAGGQAVGEPALSA